MDVKRKLLHYRLTRKLGRGGMGEVWQATDTTLDREVAIKLLPDTLAESSERLARFEREAKMLAALNHPNIATIHGLHRDGDVRFLAMELVEGDSLSALIPAEGLALSRLFDLAIQIADALGTAHDRGITHRDLKPDNVMVTNEGRVKVLDFGLAKLVGGIADDGTEADQASALDTATVTQEGRILGTFHYMSPEQAEGKPVDARSDVFALGILLYEMAVGRRPFSGDTPISTISSILKDQPPSLTDLKADLPRHLDRVVRRCLTKDPERRYPNAKEVRNELKELRHEIVSGEASSVSISTPSMAAGGSETSTRSVWKSPVVVAALLVIGAVVLGIVAVALSTVVWRGRTPETSRGGTIGTSSDAAPAFAPTPDAVTSIAVLPFADLSPDGDKEYFGDGIAEELMNRLARVDGIRVAGRSSSFAFKGQDRDLRTVGEALGVDAIIEGSVRSAGDQVRVTAQLVGVADGFQLWSDTFDRSLSDIFAVQDEIARSIVQALEDTLGGDTELGDERLARSSVPANVDAYQDYLKARHLLQRRTKESILESIDLFEQAIERDPSFAEAHAGLASAWYVAPGYTDVTDEDGLARSLEIAGRALTLGTDVAEALSVQAGVQVARLRWLEAESSYRRALELRPDDPSTLLWYGGSVLAAGRVDDGERLLTKAYELDPASGVINGWVGHAYRARGNEEGAVAQMREAARLGWGAGRLWLAWTLIEAGRDDEALEIVREQYGPDSPRANAVEILRDLEPGDDRWPAFWRVIRETGPFTVAFEGCVRAGRIDEAFELLDRYGRELDLRNNSLVRLWAPRVAPVRRDPRFADFARRVGLVDYWTKHGWPAGCTPDRKGIRCRGIGERGVSPLQSRLLAVKKRD